MPSDALVREALASLKPELEQISADIDALFDTLLPPQPDARATLYEAMRYAAIGGGKRLRPLLVVAACSLFHVDRARALRVGLAVECVHVYSLIHDDLPCMDDDDLRRGKPTLHRAYDESTAVLAGDSLHALAFEIVADEQTHEDPFVRVELVAELARAAGPAGMAGGQMMDLMASKSALDLSAVTRLQQLKTGALIGFCLEAGAIRDAASCAAMPATSAWRSRSPTICSMPRARRSRPAKGSTRTGMRARRRSSRCSAPRERAGRRSFWWTRRSNISIVSGPKRTCSARSPGSRSNAIIRMSRSVGDIRN
jgi:hypothetical protein